MYFFRDSSFLLPTEVENNILLAEFDVKMIKCRPCLCALFAETKKRLQLLTLEHPSF
jgi:hypothetical protein